MTHDRQPQTTGSKKYLGLQILRITAAFLVVVTHATYYASERLDRGFHKWAEGATGVDLFFVLSGFVMVYSSQKLMNHVRGWKIFATRRIIRIVPMYWLATSLKVAALVLTTGYVLHARFNVSHVVASYLFIPAHDSDGGVGPLLGVGWTLYFEMFFYSLFALALFWRRNIYKFVGCILVPLGLGAFFYRPDWPAAFFYLNNALIFEFFFGMLVAKLCLAEVDISKAIALPLLGLGFAGLLYPWQPETLSAAVLIHVIHGIAASVVVYSMASIEDCLQRTPRIVLYLADASYVIYLFHPLIAPAVPVALARLHLIHPWLSVACSVSIGLAGGCLVHSLAEKPVTKWLQGHFSAGKKRPSTEAVAAG